MVESDRDKVQQLDVIREQFIQVGAIVCVCVNREYIYIYYMCVVGCEVMNTHVNVYLLIHTFSRYTTNWLAFLNSTIPLHTRPKVRASECMSVHVNPYTHIHTHTLSHTHTHSHAHSLSYVFIAILCTHTHTLTHTHTPDPSDANDQATPMVSPEKDSTSKSATPQQKGHR
jgi:hypothetical protein